MRQFATLLNREFTKQEQSLPEVIQRNRFVAFLQDNISLTGGGNVSPTTTTTTATKVNNNIGLRQLECWTTGALSTFLLHVESRLASLHGTGYYTIGPCGEELLGCLGLLVDENQNDTCALHYRHLATLITKHLKDGKDLESIILDRARGYTISKFDPVAGGRHCALGGMSSDFYVTSTIASQAPAAVGRALADRILQKKSKSVHFVSVGDGSAYNAAFTSSLSVAQVMSFRNLKLPVVFGISNNDISISFKSYNYFGDTKKGFLSNSNNNLIKMFFCEPKEVENPAQMFQTSKSCFDYVRENQKPAVLILPTIRRFGHAATDRQAAYLTREEITKNENVNVIESLLRFAIATYPDQFSWKLFLERFLQIEQLCKDAFVKASGEEKPFSVVNVKNKKNDNEKELLLVVKPFPPQNQHNNMGKQNQDGSGETSLLTMRKCMNLSLKTALIKDETLVYLGEDVRHGGYYLVTEELTSISKSVNDRVIDWVPDETTLIGAGIGFSQRGLLPIVEIPYLKYLDCGLDQYAEAILLPWATNGRAGQFSGMVVRLQGFDTGVFGGNFHTHNSLYLFPDLDLYCFSNGKDWYDYFPLILAKARESRKVISVLDATENLNRRMVGGKIDWTVSINDSSSFVTKRKNLNDAIIYGDYETANVFVFAYGNGVPYALEAREQVSNGNSSKVCIVDVILLSRPSEGIVYLMKQLKKTKQKSSLVFIFADSCKFGMQNPFGNWIQTLNRENLLPKKWSVIGAEPMYNGLGDKTNFLSTEKILNEMRPHL